MVNNMRISEHIKNFSDSDGNYGRNFFKTEAKGTRRGASKFKFCYAARITCQKIQKVRQTKLPLRRRTRARGVYPFCQYVWQKSSHDLRFTQKQRHGHASFSQLSKCSKNYRRNQQYQSRTVHSKGTLVTE